jgi:hypothetical protein
MKQDNGIKFLRDSQVEHSPVHMLKQTGQVMVKDLIASEHDVNDVSIDASLALPCWLLLCGCFGCPYTTS